MLFKKFTSSGKLFIVDEFTETGITCHVEPALNEKRGDSYPVSYEAFYRKMRLKEVVIEGYDGNEGVEKLIEQVERLTTKLERDRLAREKTEREEAEKQRKENERIESERKQKELEYRKRAAIAEQLAADEDED